MDNDPQTTTSCKGGQDEERQNRRQFFNGLGKWSLAIVAAVAALRDAADDVRDGIGLRFGTGSDAAADPRQQIAKKPHLDVPHGHEHGDLPHLDARIQGVHADVPHGDVPHVDGRI